MVTWYQHAPTMTSWTPRPPPVLLPRAPRSDSQRPKGHKLRGLDFNLGMFIVFLMFFRLLTFKHDQLIWTSPKRDHTIGTNFVTSYRFDTDFHWTRCTEKKKKNAWPTTSMMSLFGCRVMASSPSSWLFLCLFRFNLYLFLSFAGKLAS